MQEWDPLPPCATFLELSSSSEKRTFLDLPMDLRILSAIGRTVPVRTSYAFARSGLFLALRTMHSAALLIFPSRKHEVFVVVAELEPQMGWIDLAVIENKGKGEEWLGQHVQDTVIDCFAVRCNDIASICNAPADRIAKPDDEGDQAADDVALVDVAAQVTRILATLPDQSPEYIEHGGTSESKEAWL